MYINDLVKISAQFIVIFSLVTMGGGTSKPTEVKTDKVIHQLQDWMKMQSELSKSKEADAVISKQQATTIARNCTKCMCQDKFFRREECEANYNNLFDSVITAFFPEEPVLSGTSNQTTTNSP